MNAEIVGLTMSDDKSDSCSDVLDLFGLDVASKLRNMASEERDKAIKLINNVLLNKKLLLIKDERELVCNGRVNSSVISLEEHDSETNITCCNDNFDNSSPSLNDNLFMKIEMVDQFEDEGDNNDVVKYRQSKPVVINDMNNETSLFIDSIEKMCDIEQNSATKHDKLNLESSISSEVHFLDNCSNNHSDKFSVVDVDSKNLGENDCDEEVILDYDFIDDQTTSEYDSTILLEPKIEICAQLQSDSLNDSSATMDYIRRYPSSEISTSESKYEHFSTTSNKVEQVSEDNDSDDSSTPRDLPVLTTDLDSEVEDMCWELLLKKHYKKKQPKKRKYWVLPQNENRFLDEHFDTLFMKLRSNENDFYSFFHVTISIFDKLFSLTVKYIQKCDTIMRRAISAEERLSVTLRYLATGNSLKSLGAEFRIGSSTISHILKDVTSAVWLVLQKTYMPKPSKDEWLNISEKFYAKTEFPNCLGVLSAKSIRIGVSKRNLVNTYFMLCVLVDPEYKFIHVELADYDQLDGNLLYNLNLGKSLKNNTLNLPDQCSLPDQTCTSVIKVPFVFLAGKQFTLQGNVIKAYQIKKSQITKAQRLFNSKFSEVFKHVDDTLAIMFGRWKLFTAPVLFKPETASMIIKAACVLHNFTITHEGYRKDEVSSFRLVDVVNRSTGHATNAGFQVRNSFVKYFAIKNNIADDNDTVVTDGSHIS